MTGDYTSMLANTPDKDMEAVRAAFNFAYDLDYDPIPTLRKLKVPSLWVLAGKDTEAPSASTIGILRGLQAQGIPIDVAVFPNADHGIIEVEQTPQGQRELERHSPGYFDLLADWVARHAFSPRSFGTAEVTPRR
jgi:dienelactone hydrolase